MNTDELTAINNHINRLDPSVNIEENRDLALYGGPCGQFVCTIINLATGKIVDDVNRYFVTGRELPIGLDHLPILNYNEYVGAPEGSVFAICNAHDNTRMHFFIQCKRIINGISYNVIGKNHGGYLFERTPARQTTLLINGNFSFINPTDFIDGAYYYAEGLTCRLYHLNLTLIPAPEPVPESERSSGCCTIL